jgi:hypothetical protein
MRQSSATVGNMDNSPADHSAADNDLGNTADPEALPEGTIDDDDDKGIADMNYETDVGILLYSPTPN